MSTIGALGVFTEVYAVTGGGPARASETMGILMYKTAFDHLEFGYAAVISIFITLSILVVTLINLFFQRAVWRDTDAEKIRQGYSHLRPAHRRRRLHDLAVLLDAEDVVGNRQQRVRVPPNWIPKPITFKTSSPSGTRWAYTNTS